jgi:hypothetical protein
MAVIGEVDVVTWTKWKVGEKERKKLMGAVGLSGHSLR